MPNNTYHAYWWAKGDLTADQCRLLGNYRSALSEHVMYKREADRLTGMDCDYRSAGWFVAWRARLRRYESWRYVDVQRAALQESVGHDLSLDLSIWLRERYNV